MSNDQKEQQENLTAVYDLRSHQEHKSVSAVEKKKQKWHTSHKDSQASLEEAHQANELAQLLDNLELENLEVFEETQAETAHLNLHGEILQAATEAAGAVPPSAPELTVAEQQSEPQTHATKPELNKSPS
jgi:hypothetical protein